MSANELQISVERETDDFASEWCRRIVTTTRLIAVITAIQLVLKDTVGKEHTYYQIVEKAQLSLDGKACRPLDLKSGLKARVTTNKSDAMSATSIDAINKTPLVLSGKMTLPTIIDVVV